MARKPKAATPELLVADANNRAIRTGLQMLLVAVLVDVLPVVYTALDADHTDWQALVKAAIRVGLMSAVSWLMRRFTNVAEPPAPAAAKRPPAKNPAR